MKLDKLHSTPRGLRFTRPVLTEGPAAHFLGLIISGLEFLYDGERVDLGFENLGISKEAIGTLVLAFYRGPGVAIPGIGLRMHQAENMEGVIGPADGTEPILPDHWKQAVLVVGPNNKPTWIGHMVRRPGRTSEPYQIGQIDPDEYQDAGEGLLLKSPTNN